MGATVAARLTMTAAVQAVNFNMGDISCEATKEQRQALHGN